ncbi:hypothetical protein H6P81_018083 [Aristolochia fimbriata]|uniref:Aminotransferase-like plant mobile domain-containing protein n=1 Tax=Aristolochia fimbriata TaxID=158543 RepID=A0AAV7E177_ARIFI|nr:hypothetical protein H6P81_018083 [Aristolochia fimbriata]
MAAPSVTLIGGLRAFDHTVTVDEETVLTLALYMEGNASHLTYCPSGESIFGSHVVKPSTLVDNSLPCGSLNRRLAIGDRVFFLSCPDSLEKEDEAAGLEAFVLHSASCLVNRPPLPCIFEDGVVERILYTPDTTLDTPIPFLFEWTTLLLGRCSRNLHNAGVFYGLWASLFQYNCDISVVRAFFDAWSTKTNTLVTCQGKLSIILMDMDRIFGLPISSQFYDEISPMVADFTDVRSSDLPYSCRCLFLAYHHLWQSSQSNVLPTTAWVKFWFRTEDNAVPVSDPWTAWGLGHTAAGTSSITQWPYLYSWLAVYFHTHREDLGGSRCRGLSFGNPSLRRSVTEELACDLFRHLPVPMWHRYVLGAANTFALVDERKKPISRQHYESLLSVRCCSLMARRSIRFFVEPYCPIRFARQFGYCQDLPGDLGVRADQRETTSLSELVALWKTSFVRLCGRLDLPLSEGPTRDLGTTFAYYTWWRYHMSPRFQAEKRKTMTVIGPIHANGGRKARSQLVHLRLCIEEEEGARGSSAHFSPFATDISSSNFGGRPSAFLSTIGVRSSRDCSHISSLEAPEAEAPREEVSFLASTVQIGSCALEGTEVVGDLVEIAPSSIQLEILQEVVPPVVQEEATTEEEAPAPVLQEAEAAPAPSIEEVVEVEAPTVKEEAILVLEVQEEASIVQEEAPT